MINGYEAISALNNAAKLVPKACAKKHILPKACAKKQRR